MLIYPSSFLSYVYRCIHSLAEASKLTFCMKFLFGRKKNCRKKFFPFFLFPPPFLSALNVTHSTLRLTFERSACFSSSHGCPCSVSLLSKFLFLCWNRRGVKYQAGTHCNNFHSDFLGPMTQWSLQLGEFHTWHTCNNAVRKKKVNAICIVMRPTH